MKLSMIFIVCLNKIYNCVVLSGEGNENGKRKNNRSNYRVATHQKVKNSLSFH